MVRNFFLSVLLLAVVSVPLTLAAPQAQQRIPQPIMVNGQQAEGLLIVQNGVPQTTTCPDPQPYTSANGASSGWACYDASSGTWLLNAQPQQSSDFYYPEPAPAYDYFGYPYPDAYGYYPYGYYGAPLFSFGFGLGHGHEHFEHGHEGHGFEHGGGGHGHAGGGHGHR